ncbi:tetratricopeptide repeat protein [Streptomyces sp. NPDC020747]|uniref:tetratricopeptide repeat protein n=1 Tax=Streptomyces sp. NPDC020747 TaxID=3365086 RepID=UPI0037972AAF
MATATENRAWVHQYRGDHLATLADHRQALDEYRSLGADRNTAIVQRGIALAEIELGRYEDAMVNLTQALDVVLTPGLQLDAAMALNGLGEAHAKAGDTEATRRYHLLALRQSRTCESPFEEARARTDSPCSSPPSTPFAQLIIGDAPSRTYESLRSPQADQVRTRPAGLSLLGTHATDSSAAHHRPGPGPGRDGWAHTEVEGDRRAASDRKPASGCPCRPDPS